MLVPPVRVLACVVQLGCGVLQGVCEGVHGSTGGAKTAD